MRPTDENQPGSTRPNLMSASRPGGGEDNILAMLERDAGRGRGSQFSSHPRTAWYAGAGALVVAMVGALGWLAWENANKVPEVTVETTLVLPSEGTSVAAAHDAPPAPAAALAQDAAHLHAPPSPSPAAAQAHAAPVAAIIQAASAAAIVQAGPADPVAPKTAGAAIIDSPAPPAEAPVMLAQAASAAPEKVQPSRLPPLVLLPPEEVGKKRAPTAAAPAPVQTKTAASKPASEEAAPRPVAKVDAAPRTANKANRKPAARMAARADAAPAARQSAKGDPATPARAAAKAPARGAAKTVTARAKKSPTPDTAAAPAKSQDAAADGDVALISAIIMHSSRHAGERAKAEAAKSCDGAKCPAKSATK